MTEEWKNDEFHKYCKKFIESAFEIIVSNLDSQKSMGNIETYAYLSFTSKKYTELQEFKDVIQCMNNDVKIKKHLDVMVGTYESQSRIEPTRIFFGMLAKLIKNYYKINKFNSKLFDELYADIEILFYTEQIPLTCKVSIKHFEIEGDMNLGNNLKIRHINQDEKDSLEETKVLRILDYLDDEYTHVFEYIVFKEKIGGERNTSHEHTNDFEILNKLISAL